MKEQKERLITQLIDLEEQLDLFIDDNKLTKEIKKQYNNILEKLEEIENIEKIRKEKEL